MGRYRVSRNVAYDDVKKVYYTTLYYGVDPQTNKPIKKTKTFKTKAEAIKTVKVHEGEKAKNELLPPSDDTFSSYMVYWLNNIAQPNLAQSTCYGYKNIISNHLIPFFKEIKIQDLGTQKINEYYSYKSKNSSLSSNTIHKHHDLLKNICKNAFYENKIKDNPVIKVIPPKVVKEEPQVYSIEEMKALLSKAKDHRLELVISLAAYLGLRRGEICGLKWSNIDFDGKIAKIRETSIQVGSNIITKSPKTDLSKRDIPIPEVLLKMLKDHENSQKKINNKYNRKVYYDNDLVICWPNGNPYRPNYISELFTKFIETNNFKKIKLHNLRHTFVSIAIAQGMNIVEISRLVGHSKVSTTMDIYAHLLGKNNPEVTDAVASAISIN